MARKVLKLQFKNANDDKRTLTVTDPKASYEEEEVKNAMQQIVASNALLVKDIPIVAPVKAYLEEVEITPIGIE